MSEHETTLRGMASAHASQARSNRAWPSIAEEQISMYAACIAGADALSRTCGTCEFYDANSSATEGVCYCTNANGWHRARSMPPTESCSKWQKGDK